MSDDKDRTGSIALTVVEFEDAVNLFTHQMGVLVRGNQIPKNFGLEIIRRIESLEARIRTCVDDIRAASAP